MFLAISNYRSVLSVIIIVITGRLQKMKPVNSNLIQPVRCQLQNVKRCSLSCVMSLKKSCNFSPPKVKLNDKNHNTNIHVFVVQYSAVKS